MDGKPKFELDLLPNPDTFGWYGFVLFIIAFIIIIFIWNYYNIIITVVVVIVFIVGVYVGREIESRFYKHKFDEILKMVRGKDETQKDK